MKIISDPIASSPSAESPEQLIARASLHIDREEWSGARAALEQAIAIDAGQVSWHGALGTACFRLGDFDSSVRAFTAATELSPADADLWTQRALAHLQLGQAEPVEEALRRALSLSPEEPTASKLLADFCFHQGRHREAVKRYGRLLDKHADKLAIALNLAACFEALGEWAMAQAAFLVVLQLDQNHSAARAAIPRLGEKARQPRQNAVGSPSSPTIEVCCPSLNRPREVIRLRNSLPDDCLFTPSLESQPRALTQIVNELFGKSTGDIVIMAADHLEFRPQCVDIIREAFTQQFPDLDGVVGLNLVNLPHLERISEYCFLALGRKFIERFTANGKYQGVFCPEYYHFYGDTEFGLYAEKAGKFHYDERAAVFTWHPNAGNAQRDRTYSASRSRKGFDDAMWRLRQARNLYWGESFEVVGQVAAEAEAARPSLVTGRAKVVPTPSPAPVGRRHADKILSCLRPNTAVLLLGTDDIYEWLEAQLPVGTTLTRQAAAGAKFDLILLTGDTPAATLGQMHSHVAPSGVVLLHGSQRLDYDEPKRAYVGYGHLGSCPEQPGEELWWGGAAELTANARASGALPVVICFYTKNTDYETVARKLIASCEHSNLDHRVVGVEPRGSWEANCAIKAEFVLDIWKSTGRPVLWVDADAILHSEPNLLRGVTADFAIHRCREWEFASGTLFFNQTPAAGALLRRWVARCKAYPRVWDQVNLDLAWEDTVASYPLETLWLPEPYCRIFDLHDGRSPAPGVVEHFQASRHLKAKVSTRPAVRNAIATPALKSARLASRRRAWQLAPADAGTVTLPQLLADAVASRLTKPGRVLCLQGGAGVLWRQLEAHGHEVHGVIAAAGEQPLWGECRAKVGGYTALPYPDGFFDQTVTFGELELLPEADVAVALAELQRVSRHLLIVLHTKPDAEDRWPDQADHATLWQGWLQGAGFTTAPLPGSTGPVVAYAWEAGARTVVAAKPEIVVDEIPINPAAHPIVVLASNPQHPLFASWLGQSAYPVIAHSRVSMEFRFPANTGLLVMADCYNQPWSTLLHQAVEQGIPTLLLADGILEYRNTFENPGISAGTVFQPVIAHKIACLGRSQARILESWGNAAQVEITGAPRFDRYAGRQRRKRAAGEPFKILVMTAITPYFTDSQHELVRRSLGDLKQVFDAGFSQHGVPFQVEWRVTKGMQKEIGVDSIVSDLTGRELAEVLERVDAVISTPSTAMIEAMLLGLPVAVLDYTNSPHYVQPAWRITAADHIKPVLAELFNPAAPKLLFQDSVLHDALECKTPAAPRMMKLADRMIRHGVRLRSQGLPLSFPPRLIPVGSADSAPAELRHRPADLHPGQPQFHEQHLSRLQVEVGQLRRYAAQLEQACQAASQRGGGAGAQNAIQWRSRFEAAKVLVELKQPKAALNQLMLSLKAAEASKQPDVILDALLEVIPCFCQLDQGRGKSLLETATVLAKRIGLPEYNARLDVLQKHLAVPVGRSQAA
jgi:tetratricopeptide (TPR) repeat protein